MDKSEKAEELEKLRLAISDVKMYGKDAVFQCETILESFTTFLEKQSLTSQYHSDIMILQKHVSRHQIKQFIIKIGSLVYWLNENLD